MIIRNLFIGLGALTILAACSGEEPVAEAPAPEPPPAAEMPAEPAPAAEEIPDLILPDNE